MLQARKMNYANELTPAVVAADNEVFIQDNKIEDGIAHPSNDQIDIEKLLDYKEVDEGGSGGE